MDKKKCINCGIEIEEEGNDYNKNHWVEREVQSVKEGSGYHCVKEATSTTLYICPNCGTVYTDEY